MILYFSATGNGEFVAKNIAHLNNDEVINLSLYLKKNEVLNLNSEKPYLVITPIYISTIPPIVVELLEKSKLEGNKNIYFIMTCAGSGVSAAGATLPSLASKMGMTYRGVEHLSMPQDYLMFFTVGSKEENETKMNLAIEKIPSLALKIKNNEDFDLTKVGAMHKMSVKPVTWLFDTFFIKPKKFYTTDECIGCGLCEKVCPLNNIKLVDKKPTWGNNCIHCTACINRCPKEAIEYGKKTQGKNRYVAIKYKAE